jgi:uncharacterized membrane protein
MTDISQIDDTQNDADRTDVPLNQEKGTEPKGGLIDPNTEDSVDEKESLRKIEEKIDIIEPDLLVDLPKQKKDQLLSFAMKVSRHSGPLPDPESLRKYNEVVPGLAERMIAMVEKEGEHRRSEQSKDGAHRREMEGKVVKEGLNFPERGQWIGLGIAVFVISIGSYLILNGFPTQGTLIITTIVISLVGIFVLGKFFKNEDKIDTDE